MKQGRALVLKSCALRRSVLKMVTARTRKEHLLAAPGIPENKWKTRPCQEYREFAGPSLQFQVTRTEANSDPVDSGGLLWLGKNKASGKA